MITTLEKRVIKSRKQLIIEKMEEYSAYFGSPDDYCFIEYLEANTTFIFGCCVDMDKFKKYYLTSFDKLNQFYDKYTNTCLDVSELYFIGFGDDLRIISEDMVGIGLYKAIEDYNFDLQTLSEFEAFVDSKYNKCLL